MKNSTCQDSISPPRGRNEMIAHPLFLVTVAQVRSARRLKLGVLQNIVRSHSEKQKLNNPGLFFATC